VNARTLETQVSRLLSSEFAEVRLLGEKLKAAAAGTAWNPDPAAPEVHVAPTLVKYATPNTYEIESRAALTQAAEELMCGAPIAPAPIVDLVEPEVGVSNNDALEIDLATSLLYPHCHYPFRQLRDAVKSLPAARRSEIVTTGVANRGRHDELARAFSAGQMLRFDILMDIGGFRDMHRHRKCIQLRQGYTTAHGFDLPEYIDEVGLRPQFDSAAQRAFAASANFAPEVGAYLLPLATRCRSIFKMDFAEAVYIADLRSQPQGHTSSRRVAWLMYQAVKQQYPSLASLFHVTDIDAPIDLLKR
jgi:hypothetical protein